MDKLPLELKQRICSFLHASPRLLKPIRLVSKDFASAAAPYLIPRLFLFRHPDSCAEVKAIVEHPVFSKYVTTLVVDLSVLKSHDNIESWIEDHTELEYEEVEWSDFEPDGQEYDEYGPVLETCALSNKFHAQRERFYEARQEATRSLQSEYEGNWKAHQDIVRIQASTSFQSLFLETVTHTFKICPNLTNIVISPPVQIQDVIARRTRIFEDILPISASWVRPKDSFPVDFQLREMLQATNHSLCGLNSLTIIDFPFGCSGKIEIESLKSLTSLKHVRISHNRLNFDPTTKLNLNQEVALQAAHSLETLWVEMPAHIYEHVNANSLLRATDSRSLRDILLSNVCVSENVLVDFLLRHASSLQHLSFGLALSTGSWVSTLRRISGRMEKLERVQLTGITETRESEMVTFSSEWCLKARNFLTKGTELPEPVPYDQFYEFEEERSSNCSSPLRNHILPEDGLWEEYDGEVNSYF